VTARRHRGVCEDCSRHGYVRHNAMNGRRLCSSCEKQMQLFNPALYAIARITNHHREAPR
jgi:hypothetical protein